MYEIHADLNTLLPLLENQNSFMLHTNKNLYLQNFLHKLLKLGAKKSPPKSTSKLTVFNDNWSKFARFKKQQRI